MKNVISNIIEKTIVLILTICLLASCSKDDKVEVKPTTITITMKNIQFSISENPKKGQKIGTVSAKTNKGTIIYSLSDQSPSGAMAIDPKSGDITVSNEALFDFETNPKITAKVTAKVEKVTKTATVTVNLIDKDETPSPDRFVTTWQTYANNESITIPTDDKSFAYDYSVDWGDGTTSKNQKGNATHKYTNAGIYTVKITGTFPAIYFNNTGSKRNIRTIEKWGKNVWKSMKAAFSGCATLTYKATDVPDLSQVTNMARMFERIISFNANINNWDVSNVTHMYAMFARTSNFNQPLDKWNVSKVTNMREMFSRSRLFNQDLSSWDVSNVTDMAGMFSSTLRFNGNISSWNVSKVNNMSRMFTEAAAFDQDLSKWNVSNVTDMSWIFSHAPKFNSNISTWKTTKLVNAKGMFHSCKAFNQNLRNSDMSKVTDMS